MIAQNGPCELLEAGADKNASVRQSGQPLLYRANVARADGVIPQAAFNGRARMEWQVQIRPDPSSDTVSCPLFLSDILILFKPLTIRNHRWKKREASGVGGWFGRKTVPLIKAGTCVPVGELAPNPIESCWRWREGPASKEREREREGEAWWLKWFHKRGRE